MALVREKKNFNILLDNSHVLIKTNFIGELAYVETNCIFEIY